jgi:hypothetical protein
MLLCAVHDVWSKLYCEVKVVQKLGASVCSARRVEQVVL